MEYAQQPKLDKVDEAQGVLGSLLEDYQATEGRLEKELYLVREQLARLRRAYAGIQPQENVSLIGGCASLGKY